MKRSRSLKLQETHSRLEMETPAGPEQLLSEDAGITPFRIRRVFKEFIFHKQAVPGIHIVIRTGKDLPREVGVTGASAQVGEGTDIAAGRFPIISADAEANIGLEFSITEFQYPVGHESAGIDPDARAAGGGDSTNR